MADDIIKQLKSFREQMVAKFDKFFEITADIQQQLQAHERSKGKKIGDDFCFANPRLPNLPYLALPRPQKTKAEIEILPLNQHPSPMSNDSSDAQLESEGFGEVLNHPPFITTVAKSRFEGLKSEVLADLQLEESNYEVEVLLKLPLVMSLCPAAIESSKNSDAWKVFDELTSRDLNPQKAEPVFVDLGKEICIYMEENIVNNEPTDATLVVHFEMNDIENIMSFDPGGDYKVFDSYKKLFYTKELVLLKNLSNSPRSVSFLFSLIFGKLMHAHMKISRSWVKNKSNETTWSFDPGGGHVFDESSPQKIYPFQYFDSHGMSFIAKPFFLEQKMNATSVAHTCNDAIFSFQFVGLGEMRFHSPYQLQPMEPASFLSMHQAAKFLYHETIHHWILEEWADESDAFQQNGRMQKHQHLCAGKILKPRIYLMLVVHPVWINVLCKKRLTIWVYFFFMVVMGKSKRVILYNVNLKIFSMYKDLNLVHKLFSLMSEMVVKPDSVAILTATSCIQLISMRETTIEWVEKMSYFEYKHEQVTRRSLTDPELESLRLLWFDLNNVVCEYWHTLFWNLSYWDSIRMLVGEEDGFGRTTWKTLFCDHIFVVLSLYLFPLPIGVGVIPLKYEEWTIAMISWPKKLCLPKYTSYIKLSKTQNVSIFALICVSKTEWCCLIFGSLYVELEVFHNSMSEIANVARVNAMVCGARGIIVHMNILARWSSFQVLLQDMDRFNGLAIESSLSLSLSNGLVKGGEVLRSLCAEVHCISFVCALAQKEFVNSFFSQNSFRSYKTHQKSEIPQLIQFLQTSYPQGKPLATVFVHGTLIEILDTTWMLLLLFTHLILVFVEDLLVRTDVEAFGCLWLDTMFDQPLSKPPPSFRHLSREDTTHSRGEYCYENRRGLGVEICETRSYRRS